MNNDKHKIILQEIEFLGKAGMLCAMVFGFFSYHNTLSLCSKISPIYKWSGPMPLDQIKSYQRLKSGCDVVNLIQLT